MSFNVIIIAISFFLPFSCASAATGSSVDIKLPTPFYVTPTISPSSAVYVRYRVEFGEDSVDGPRDRIYLAQDNGTPEVLAFEGRIDRIFVPRDVNFNLIRNAAPNRIRVTESRDPHYGFNFPFRHAESNGEFRFYSQDRLYSLVTNRFSAEKGYTALKPLLVSIRIPPSLIGADFHMTWDRGYFKTDEGNFTEWTITNLNGFDMTYLIQISTGVAVPLIRGFLGGVFLGPVAPGLERYKLADRVYYRGLRRTIFLSDLPAEALKPPLEFETYRRQRYLDSAQSRDVKRAGKIQAEIEDKLDAQVAKISRHLSTRPSQEFAIQEKTAILNDPISRDFALTSGGQKSVATLKSWGKQVTRHILLREFPELVYLAKESDATNRAIENFSEAISELWFLNWLDDAGIKELIETQLEIPMGKPRKSHSVIQSCQRRLQGTVDNPSNAKTDFFIEMATGNLSRIRSTLHNFRKRSTSTP